MPKMNLSNNVNLEKKESVDNNASIQSVKESKDVSVSSSNISCENAFAGELPDWDLIPQSFIVKRVKR